MGEAWGRPEMILPPGSPARLLSGSKSTTARQNTEWSEEGRVNGRHPGQEHYSWFLLLIQVGTRETSTKNTAAIPRYRKVQNRFSRAAAREPPAKVYASTPGTMQTALTST